VWNFSKGLKTLKKTLLNHKGTKGTKNNKREKFLEKQVYSPFSFAFLSVLCAPSRFKFHLFLIFVGDPKCRETP